MGRVYVGIDPDVKKSGVAIWYKETKQLSLKNLTFFELFDEFKSLKQTHGNELFVVVEAGWLNAKSNWHEENKGVRVASKVSLGTGANHETGRKIAEMCSYLNIDYKLSVPRSAKYKAIPFEMLTKYHGKTNQETRDAAMLVFGI